MRLLVLTVVVLLACGDGKDIQDREMEAEEVELHRRQADANPDQGMIYPNPDQDDGIQGRGVAGGSHCHGCCPHVNYTEPPAKGEECEFNSDCGPGKFCCDTKKGKRCYAPVDCCCPSEPQNWCPLWDLCQDDSDCGFNEKCCNAGLKCEHAQYKNCRPAEPCPCPELCCPRDHYQLQFWVNEKCEYCEDNDTCPPDWKCCAYRDEHLGVVCKKCTQGVVCEKRNPWVIPANMAAASVEADMDMIK